VVCDRSTAAAAAAGDSSNGSSLSPTNRKERSRTQGNARSEGGTHATGEREARDTLRKLLPRSQRVRRVPDRTTVPDPSLQACTFRERLNCSVR
jgi:hypothetical protein